MPSIIFIASAVTEPGFVFLNFSQHFLTFMSLHTSQKILTSVNDLSFHVFCFIKEIFFFKQFKHAFYGHKYLVLLRYIELFVNS